MIAKKQIHPNSLANLVDRPPDYGEWLRSLTPEEREAHELAKLKRRTMKAAVQQQIDTVQAQWAHALSQAAERVLQRAIDTGDPQALATVWDRIVGKPKDTVEHTVAQEDEVEDIVARLQADALHRANIPATVIHAEDTVANTVDNKSLANNLHTKEQ